LAGWWLPALRPKGLADRPENWAKRTIVLCHGIGSGRQRQLPLAHHFVQRGFNVFLFDFRAHGNSDGMFVSYGDRERLDVLAAVKWVRANHPHESGEIFGVGVNTGAVALLGAAADPELGQQINAIALYEPYARFRELSRDVARWLLTPPLAWIATHVSMPMASLHAGSNLLAFAPVHDAGKVWSRPVLVVHGQGATFTPALQSMDVYQQLWQPKEQFWPAENYSANRARLRGAASYPAIMTELFRIYIGTSEDICDDPGVRAATLEFFERARRVPVI
jgi:pimeloyl-ACP methyl ester carboxylesterase